MEFKWLCIAFAIILSVSMISNCVIEIHKSEGNLEQLEHKVDSLQLQLDSLEYAVYD